jgi:hypothetical protein
MTPQTKKVVVITISLLSLAGLSYFAYTYFKKKKEEDVLPTPSDTIPTTTPTTTTSGTTNTIPPIIVESPTSGLKPLSNAEIVSVTKGFQDWMDFFNPKWLVGRSDKKQNLNKDISLGYGKFGSQTKKAISNLSNAKGFASYLLKNGYNVNSLKRIAMWLSTQGVNFPMAV